MVLSWGKILKIKIAGRNHKEGGKVGYLVGKTPRDGVGGGSWVGKRGTDRTGSFGAGGEASALHAPSTLADT